MPRPSRTEYRGAVNHVNNQREIGEWYGGITSMAVCMARRKAKEDAETVLAVRKLAGQLDAHG